MIFLNIPSTADGTNPWKQPSFFSSSSSSSFAPQSISDGLIEVIGLNSALHLVSIQAKTNGGFNMSQFSLKKIIFILTITTTNPKYPP